MKNALYRHVSICLVFMAFLFTLTFLWLPQKTQASNGTCSATWQADKSATIVSVLDSYPSGASNAETDQHKASCLSTCAQNATAATPYCYFNQSGWGQSNGYVWVGDSGEYCYSGTDPTQTGVDSSHYNDYDPYNNTPLNTNYFFNWISACTPANGAPQPTVTLSANPASISLGGSSTLTWSSTNATSCVGTNFSTSNAPSGSVVVSPTDTTAYSVTCTGSGGSATDSKTVTVTTSGPPNVTLCLANGVVNTPYTFTYQGDAPPQNGFGAKAVLHFDDVSYSSSGYDGTSASIRVSHDHSWSTPGTYWIYGIGPEWSANPICNGSGGSEVCTATGSPGSGTLTGPDRSGTGGPAWCKVNISAGPASTLKVCQNSCSSGVQRGNTSSTQSFTMARTATENLVACYNTASGCTDGTGDVTASTSWGENTGSNVVSLSGTNPKVVTANNTGTEGISATYSGQTANMSVNVTCVPSVTCDNSGQAGNYCRNQTYTVDNGCGTTITCNGAKSCDFNWKEVAP